jgi:hypothetical protein
MPGAWKCCAAPSRRPRRLSEAMNMDDFIRAEERKRDAAYDPVQRWQHIQHTITWAEANLPPDQRRNRPRTPKLLPGREIHADWT